MRLSISGQYVTNWIFALGLALGLAIRAGVAAGGGGVVYPWEGKATVESAPGRTKEVGPNVLYGEVEAGGADEALARAREEAIGILGREYPTSRLVDGSLKVEVHDPRPTDIRARVRLSLVCESKIVEHVKDVDVAGIEIASHDDVTDAFDAEAIVTVDGIEQPYRGRIRTFGRGAAGEWFLNFPIWEGTVPVAEGGKEVRVKVTSEARGRKAEVGEFRIRLRNRVGKLEASCEPVAFAAAERTDNPGPIFWSRLSLSGGGVHYRAIVNVVDEATLSQSGARIVAVINKLSGKPLEIRPSEFNADLGWGPGNRAQAQQGPLRPTGFVCQEWLMLPVKHAGETVYRLHNLSSMKVLDIDSTEITKPGAKASQWDYPVGFNKANQLFRLVPTGEGWFKIVNYESRMLLDFNFFAIDNDSGMCLASQWGENPSPAHQLFRFVDR